MLIEFVEYGHKIEEKVKAMQSEIEKNIQGTNSDRKETGTQINGVDQKEEINILLQFFLIFIVIQLQLYAFSPHPSTPPQLNPPPPSPLILSMCPL